MTHLYFRHSPVYESMLSRMDNTPYSHADMQAGFEHAQKFAAYWEAHNEVVFEMLKHLGFGFADFWIAYFVRPRDNMFPFSDPLTIFIDKDFEKTASAVIHELVHAVMTYPGNENLTEKILNELNEKFPEVAMDVKFEVTPALITRGILARLLGKEKTSSLQAPERNYPILGEAWKLIDSTPDLLLEIIDFEKLPR